MNNYNYYEAVKTALKEHLEEEFESCYSDVESIEELEEKLHDNCWANDHVTGNASGSYFFNSWESRECVIDNIDLCKEAIEEFCCESREIAEHFLNEDWEYFDVTIRCYVLGSCIYELLEEGREDFEEWLESKEENE